MCVCVKISGPVGIPTDDQTTTAKLSDPEARVSGFQLDRVPI